MHECSKCRVTKEWSEFRKYKCGYWKNDKGEGIDSQCKLCRKKHAQLDSSKKMVNENIRNKRKNDPQFRMSHNLRSRTRKGIIAQGGIKSESTEKLLGCSFYEAKIHIENQFVDGMSWENYGEWEIDHIRPMISFDLTDPEQQKLCCHYTNLQPLWAEENNVKNGNWCGEWDNKNSVSYRRYSRNA